MDTNAKIPRWQLEFLNNAYIGKKLYEKYCYEVDKKYSITINEGEVLYHIFISGGECTAKDIVEHNWISKSRISKAVEHLTSLGYVSQRTDENDRRFTRLRLTEKSTVLVTELDKAAEEFLEQLFRGLNSDEIEVLNKLVEKTINNVRDEGNI